MTDKHHTEWTDRFSDYLAGELDEADRADVDEHLAACGACREVLAGLRRIVVSAAEAGDLHPPRDLWPGIERALTEARRFEEQEGEGDVITLPTTPRGPVRRPPRLGPGRLAAAAVLLVALTAATTWRLASGAARPLAPPAEVAPSASQVARTVAAPAPPPALADQVATLEEVLDSARETLDPNTVLVLERNLTAIERAIADSKEALALDPGNAFLEEHLERMYQRKLIYLQDVARVVQWAG